MNTTKTFESLIAEFSEFPAHLGEILAASGEQAVFILLMALSNLFFENRRLLKNGLQRKFSTSYLLPHRHILNVVSSVPNVYLHGYLYDIGSTITTSVYASHTISHHRKRHSPRTRKISLQLRHIYVCRQRTIRTPIEDYS